MATKTFDQLGAGSGTPVGDEVFPVWQSAAAKKLTAAQARGILNVTPSSFPNCDQLTGSGNWTVPVGITCVEALMIPGGGGGGGIATGAAATGTSGSVGIILRVRLAVTPGDLIPYSCGAGGPGGPAGNNNGTAGGDTTFGPFTAKGGPGGVGSASGNAASPVTTAVVNALLAGSAIIPDADQQVLATYRAANPGTGLSGVGGVTASNGHGQPGAAALNSAGGDATGYGNAGAGAGHNTGANLKGGDGTQGTIFVLF